MLFDPVKQRLYTDQGELIKNMYCPVQPNWDQLEEAQYGLKTCSHCQHSVLDTKDLSEDELLQILEKKADTCLKVDLNQENIRVI